MRSSLVRPSAHQRSRWLGCCQVALVESVPELGGQRAGELDAFVRRRGVRESEQARVQREPRRAWSERALELPAVLAIAEHGMTEPREVDADLMRASGLEPCGDEGRRPGRAAQRLDRSDMRD